VTATDPADGRGTITECGSNSQFLDLLKGAVMELPNYELVRYPSGQLIITKSDAKSSFRDIVGVYTNEVEAQRALERLNGQAGSAEPSVHSTATLPRVA
jgi:hypothetical protein